MQAVFCCPTPGIPAVSMGCGTRAGGGNQGNVTYSIIASTSLVNHPAISYSIYPQHQIKQLIYLSMILMKLDIWITSLWLVDNTYHSNAILS